MALPPRDHRISLADAAACTRRHREAGAPAVTAETLHADQVLALLQQQGCAALRIYYGRTEEGNPTLVLVGADADGRDMTDGVILERTYPCPPYCSAPGALTG